MPFKNEILSDRFILTVPQAQVRLGTFTYLDKNTGMPAIFLDQKAEKGF